MKLIPWPYSCMASQIKSPTGQMVLAALHPEADQALVLNRHLTPDVWKILWKRTRKVRPVSYLLSLPLNKEQVEMVIARERRTGPLCQLARYTLLSDEQIATMSEKSGLSVQSFKLWQEKSAADRYRIAMAVAQPRIPSPEHIAWGMTEKLDRSFRDAFAPLLGYILDRDLDPAGVEAWETACSLLADDFDGTIQELIQVSTLL